MDPSVLMWKVSFHHGLIFFFKRMGGQTVLGKRMFGKKNDSRGSPVQTGDRMGIDVETIFVKIVGKSIGQRVGGMNPVRMCRCDRGFIKSDIVLIFKKDIKGHLSRDDGGFF